VRLRAPRLAGPALHRALILSFAALLSLGESARAQVEATPPPPRNPITSRLGRTSEERDRFELGAAVPDGYFDVVGTFGYRRFIHESGQFEQSMQIEVTGIKKEYLIEGSLSLYYFFRPLITFREEWRVRPLLEICTFRPPISSDLPRPATARGPTSRPTLTAAWSLSSRVASGFS